LKRASQLEILFRTQHGMTLLIWTTSCVASNEILAACVLLFSPRGYIILRVFKVTFFKFV